ncbi:MAG: hypothetical protein WCG87_00645 [Bacteroidota bacterium]
MFLTVVLIVGIVAFLVSQAVNNRKAVREHRSQMQRKETLDAILKNNKDRYPS